MSVDIRCMMPYMAVDKWWFDLDPRYITRTGSKLRGPYDTIEEVEAAIACYNYLVAVETQITPEPGLEVLSKILTETVAAIISTNAFKREQSITTILDMCLKYKRSI